MERKTIIPLYEMPFKTQKLESSWFKWVFYHAFLNYGEIFKEKK